MRTSLIVTMTVLAAARAMAATDEYLANWPQWRGPTGNGIALSGNPPLTWSETENVRWKTAIPGEGHSTPIVWSDHVFILTAVKTGRTEDGTVAAPQGRDGPPPRRGFDRAPQRRRPDGPPPGNRRGGPGRRGFGDGTPNGEYAFTTICIDRKTGGILWQKVGRTEIPHEGRQPSNTYCSGSPVTDGESVYSFFGSQGLYCYDFDGNLVWEKDLGKIRTRNGFGEGTSPALHGDTLVILRDSEDDSFLHALDKNTGKEIWKVARDERTGWATPYIVEVDGSPQVIINQTGAVRSYDLASGGLVWSCGGQTANAIPSVVADDERVYAMSGFRGNAAYAIDLNAKGTLTDDSEAVRWRLGRGTPYVPSPMLSGDYLFFCKANSGIVTCVNPQTGEAYYSEERVDGISGVYASPVGVAGRIYLASQEGNVAVIEQGPEFKILATNSLADPIDATPAIVGDELLIRTHRNLYCIAPD